MDEAERHDASGLVADTVDHAELLRRVPAVVYIADLGHDGVFHFISSEVESLLGYTAEEWCADPHIWADRIHPEDRDRVLAQEEADRHGITHLQAVEYRLLHRDGTAIWVRDAGRQAAARDGTVMWHGVISEIGDRKAVEDELARRAAQQSAVATLGEHALKGVSTEALMDEATRATVERLDVDVSGVLRYVAEQGDFVLTAQSGGSDDVVGVVREPSGRDSPAGLAMLERAPVIVSDWHTEARFVRGQRVDALGLRSTVCVPIEGIRGFYGVLGVHSCRPGVYRPDEIDFLQSLANVLADALERQAVDAEIRHRALHDPLTGLPNRALFLDRVEHGLAALERRGGLAAVLFLDFDHFKLINDSLGHAVGDEMLQTIAGRLRRTVRAEDTVARFGGDEFGVLVERIATESEAIDMAERLATAFSRPLLVAGTEHFMSVSVGIAIARGGERAPDLIRDADAAMYRAKDRGRARYEIFDDAMRGRALERLRLELDLRRAVERDELRLVYQPVLALPRGTLVGVEALVRWEHPDRGLVTPDRFIPVAEETGLIEPIGRWVLETACRQAAGWHAAFPDAPPLSVSVNVSPVQLSRPGVVATVETALARSGLAPAALCLELTETALMREPEAAADTLRALKRLGINLALDDFGTGYSSLALLPRLPFDAVKIDRSFIDGLAEEAEERAITEAILAIARSMNLFTVGEGVETDRQLAELVRLECPLAQGYLFSRPMSAEEINAMLENEPAWQADRRFPLPE